MSQPNHPLPHEIYVRRRIAAVVVVVLAVALVWWLVSSLSGSGEDPAPAAATSASPAASSSSAPSSSAAPSSSSAPGSSSSSAAPTSEENPSEVPERNRDLLASAPEEVANKTTCAVEDLQVQAVPGAPSFGPQQQPNFFVNVGNPTKGDCRVDLRDHPLQFEVFTLNSYERVWSDIDCNAPEDTGQLELKPGQVKSYELTAWSRTTSAPGACEGRQPVNPGPYLLYGHVGDNVSEPATFNLQ